MVPFLLFQDRQITYNVQDLAKRCVALAWGIGGLNNKMVTLQLSHELAMSVLI